MWIGERLRGSSARATSFRESFTQRRIGDVFEHHRGGMHVIFREVSASRARQLQRRFVAGCLDDNMIARLQERVIGGKDSFFGCRDNDNVLRSGGFIDRGCSGAQFWCAFALRISKLLREESVCGVGFKCQNICNRNAFCITRRKQVGRSELVQCEVLLNTEWCDLHSTYDRNSKNGNASNEVLSNI